MRDWVIFALPLCFYYSFNFYHVYAVEHLVGATRLLFSRSPNVQGSHRGHLYI